MRDILASLPFMKELQAARNAKRGKTRRQSDVAPQILDITVRKREVQVSKNKRKMEVYINSIQDLQWIIDQVWLDLMVEEDHNRFQAQSAASTEIACRGPQPAQQGLAEDHDAEHDQEIKKARD